MSKTPSSQGSSVNLKKNTASEEFLSQIPSQPVVTPATTAGPHVEFPTAPAVLPKTGTVHMRAEGIKKQYRKGATPIPVLRGVNLEIRHGEFLAIIGQSGSGKSTLLHVLGTLDAPDTGEIWMDKRRIDNLPSGQRDRIRNQQVGMIFQFYHLLPELTALENVLMPQMIAMNFWQYHLQRKKHRQRAIELLNQVGLGHRLNHKPRELSGGEMQRAAIARALVAEPEILLADEPTGNLDQKTGEEILGILRTLNRQRNLTIVMVTHDMAVARQADRIVKLVEGKVQTA